MTWSYFVTYVKWFYTDNKHNLLHLKYTNKEREIQTTRHMEWGVHEWCACLLVSLLYFCDVLVCMFVCKSSGQIYPVVRVGVRYCFMVIGKSGVWTIFSLFLCQWLMTVDPLWVCDNCCRGEWLTYWWIGEFFRWLCLFLICIIFPSFLMFLNWHIGEGVSVHSHVLSLKVVAGFQWFFLLGLYIKNSHANVFWLLLVSTGCSNEVIDFCRHASSGTLWDVK